MPTDEKGQGNVGFKAFSLVANEMLTTDYQLHSGTLLCCHRNYTAQAKLILLHDHFGKHSIGIATNKKREEKKNSALTLVEP